MEKAKIIIKSDMEGTNLEISGNGLEIGNIASNIVTHLLNTMYKVAHGNKEIAKDMKYAMLDAALTGAEIDLDDLVKSIKEARKCREEMEAMETKSPKGSLEELLEGLLKKIEKELEDK